MNHFLTKLIEKAKLKGIIPEKTPEMPGACVCSAELYLSFACNDKCDHCITESAYEREEVMTPEQAHKAIDNISKHSVLNSLRILYGNGDYNYTCPELCSELDNLKKPPKRLIYSLIQKYNICALGRDGVSEWVTDEGRFRLNFRKPTIRLSGGEFSLWPKSLNGKKLAQEERLKYQQDLILKIRKTLPEYDLWILTNGRFAADQERADRVIGSWAKAARPGDKNANTRICISVDIFHKPPSKSTVNDMLNRIWSSAWKYGFKAPHLYGIPNQTIGLTGRALDNFRPGKIEKHNIKNASKSSFNPFTFLIVDPNDLDEKGGCQETKGFVVENGQGHLLVHNIFIAPSGHIAYCCACVGDYGDFINDPGECMKNIVTDPLAVALRKRETVVPLLNLAVEMDPTIKIFGSGKNSAVTGSTCYQVLSGKRIN